MTSRNALDPDPFDLFFDSVMVFVIAIFHDFENSLKKSRFQPKAKIFRYYDHKCIDIVLN